MLDLYGRRHCTRNSLMNAQWFHRGAAARLWPKEKQIELTVEKSAYISLHVSTMTSKNGLSSKPKTNLGQFWSKWPTWPCPEPQSDSRCGKLWQGVERRLIFLHSRLEDADAPEYYWKHKVAEVTEVARFIPQFPRVCTMCHAWAQVNALQRCSSKSSAVV